MGANNDISADTFDRLMHESIGGVDLGDDKLVDKSDLMASHQTILTSRTITASCG